MFDHFWEFDRLVEDRAPRRSGDHGILLVLWAYGPRKGLLGFMGQVWHVNPWAYPHLGRFVNV
jgi:hypothetical protein